MCRPIRVRKPTHENATRDGNVRRSYALDKETNMPVDAMHVTINGNLFTLRVVSSNQHGGLVRQRQREADPLRDADGLGCARRGPAWRNAITTTSKPIASMTADIANAANIAVALPQDIASAIRRERRNTSGGNLLVKPS